MRISYIIKSIYLLVSNVCQIERGNCPETHLCLPNGRGGRTCACPDSEDSEEEEEECQDFIY